MEVFQWLFRDLQVGCYSHVIAAYGVGELYDLMDVVLPYALKNEKTTILLFPNSPSPIMNKALKSIHEKSAHFLRRMDQIEHDQVAIQGLLEQMEKRLEVVVSRHMC